MKTNCIYKEVAEEHGLSPEIVEKIYVSFWEFIRNKIEVLPLKQDISECEYDSLKTSFNIPHLGKLYCTYKEQYKKVNIHKKIKDKNNDKDKKD